MKRSPMPQRRTPLKGHTWRRRKTLADALWCDARDEVLERDQWDCQGAARGLVHDCDFPLDVHHVKPRSQGGTHELSNLICLCRPAHRWVHEHPAESYRMGLLVRSAA